MKRGFTLMELLVTVAIIAVLAALLFPAVGKMMGEGKSAACAANLRQISGLVYQYVGENDGQLPASYDGSVPLTLSSLWLCKLTDQAGIPRTPWVIGSGAGPEQVFICPSTPTLGRQGVSNIDLSYGWNYLGLTLRDTAANPYGMITKLASVPHPSRTIMVADSNGAGNPNFTYVISPTQFTPDCRHSGQANVLFVDGHVERVKREILITDDLYRLEK